MADGPTPAAGPITHSTLRQASQALLEAWDWQPPHEVSRALDGPIAALRAHLARARARARGNGGGSRIPREDTKQKKVLALLGRTEGASPHMLFSRPRRLRFLSHTRFPQGLR